MSKSPEYAVWCAMIHRCTSTKNQFYDYYGGRGITVCERWLNSFENFINDLGERPTSNHSLERKDSNGNYEPSNCCWATRTEQMVNTRTRKDNKSGVRGVSWEKGKARWKATIRTKGKSISLGYFDSIEKAASARKNAEIKYFGRTVPVY